ncbi:hypothetical protein JCM16303_006547 [Sporobolomyces ruberrimus]
MSFDLDNMSPGDTVDLAPASVASDSPSLATLLPNELLLAIFEFARPPSASAGRGWYARLAMVHSSWRDAAQECLAKVVVIKREDQIKLLDEAIRTAGIGGKVKKIVIQPLDTNDRERGPGARKCMSLSFGRKIADFLESNGGNVNTVRIRCFGSEPLSGFGDCFLPRLPALAAFEYSSDYSTNRLESNGIFTAINRNPSLKSFALGYRPRHGPLQPFYTIWSRQIEPEVAQMVDWFLNDSDYSISPAATLTAITKLEDVYRASYPNAARLEQAKFSASTFSLTLFVVLTATSFRTITTLAFRRVWINAEDPELKHRELFVLLRRVFARQLEEFQWEDPLTELVEGRTNPSLVPEDALWTFLGQCTKVIEALSDPLAPGEVQLTELVFLLFA